MSKQPYHFDGSVFRATDVHGTTLEVRRLPHDGSLVVSLDSNDAPEQALILRGETPGALVQFLAGQG